jgi:hypothetical protein
MTGVEVESVLPKVARTPTAQRNHASGGEQSALSSKSDN